MNNERAIIQKTYRWALGNGLVNNKKQFAQAVGLNVSSITSIINGDPKFSGKSSIGRVLAWKDKVSSNLQDADVANELTQRPEPNQSYWFKFRNEAAKDIVCAILSAGMEQTNDENEHFRTFEELAKVSIKWADELIKQLKGHE